MIFTEGRFFAGKGDRDRAYETPVSEDSVERDKAVSPANVKYEMAKILCPRVFFHFLRLYHVTFKLYRNAHYIILSNKVHYKVINDKIRETTQPFFKQKS
jgi:hypothetical protein